MEVRDIFEMRKEGRYEEAYQAIVRLYAVHQGPHTNLCMFWCTHDLLKLRLKEKRMDESRRLLYQLVKALSTCRRPSVDGQQGDYQCRAGHGQAGGEFQPVVFHALL